jgi:hypothetical protein
MLRTTFCRFLVIGFLALGFALTPVAAQAAPPAGADDDGAWGIVGELRRLWTAVWGYDDRGPGIEPGVVRPLTADPAPSTGGEVAPAGDARSERGRLAGAPRPSPRVGSRR